MKLTRIAIAVLACAGTATAFAGGKHHSQTSGSGMSGTDFSAQGSAAAHDRETIRQVQEQLNSKGHSLTTDGVMGPRTRAALKEYQQSQGISASGSIDQQTLGALGIASSASADSSMSGSVGASTTTRSSTSAGSPPPVGNANQNFGGPPGGPSGVGSPGEATPPLPRNEGSSSARTQTPVGNQQQQFGGPAGGPSGVGSTGEVTPPVERATGSTTTKGRTGSAPSSSNPPVGSASQNFGGPPGGPSGVGSPGEATPPIDRVQGQGGTR
jgi:peptidoglycan hydrolase-like protein with peptidoglycan-binding domain